MSMGCARVENYWLVDQSLTIQSFWPIYQPNPTWPVKDTPLFAVLKAIIDGFFRQSVFLVVHSIHLSCILVHSRFSRMTLYCKVVSNLLWEIILSKSLGVFFWLVNHSIPSIDWSIGRSSQSLQFSTLPQAQMYPFLSSETAHFSYDRWNQ